MPPDTQGDRGAEVTERRYRSFLRRIGRSPLALALVVTLANAAKPVVIDDTAYITYARHISANPLDPYGFEFFWYAVPEPAFDVLCPPVVPYWLAIGIAIIGEHPALLKLWLFPFVWAFAWAVRDLLRRFARGTESRLLPLVVLSPAVLPTVNLMLDVPALALGLSAVAVFERAAGRESWRLAIAAGLLAGLAMQTKYTALLIPPILAWYGLTHRRVRLVALSIGIATTLFVGWELLLVQKYGRSHFAFHALSQKPAAKPGEAPLAALVREKSALGPPLVAHLGCLGIGVILVAGSALGVKHRRLAAAASVWATGFVLVMFLPQQRTLVGNTSLVTGFWQAFGVLFLAALAACAVILAFWHRKSHRPRLSADAAFLVGWVLVELAGYFALTPFGAARRVIGLVVVGSLLAGHLSSRVELAHPSRRPPRWVFAFGIAAGVAVTALDTLDAFPEKWCAELAAAVSAERPPAATAWYSGHWGFQFYCERAGMRPFVPTASTLMPGDVLVLPLYPDPDGFYRPYAGWDVVPPPERVAEVVAEFAWDDWISAQTIPKFYCGVDPVAGRDHPRLRVAVYRVKEKWTAPGQ